MLSRFSSRVYRQVRSTSHSFHESERPSSVTLTIWCSGLLSGSVFGVYEAYQQMRKEKNEATKYVYAVAYPAIYGAVGLGLAIFYPLVVSGTILYGAHKVGEYIDKKTDDKDD